MKRFIFTVLCVSVFFTGLGSLLERAGASLKSDDKALELLRKARAAVGGDQAVGGVRSMTITGKATKTFDFEGVAKTENGDLEINFELPNKMSRSLKMGAGDGNQLVDKQFDVVVVRKGDGDGDNLKWKTVEPGNADGVRKVTVVKKDGSSEEIKIDDKEPIILKRDGNTVVSENKQTATVDGKKVFIRTADGVGGGEFKRSNELLRTTLSLLASAPEGLDVSYAYVGEGSVDGNTVDIIAANDGSSTLKLFLDRSTSLPRMVSFEGPKPFMIRFKKGDVKPGDEETRVFERRLDAPEMAEFQIKFSDFRTTGGLQLPFKWTQTIGGKEDEVIDITAYEINPANIADKFKEEPTRVFMRMKKEQ
jgi:hypothetical protein